MAGLCTPPLTMVLPARRNVAYSSGFSLHFIVLAVAASLPPKYRSDLLVAFQTKFRRGPQYFDKLIV